MTPQRTGTVTCVDRLTCDLACVWGTETMLGHNCQASSQRSAERAGQEDGRRSRPIPVPPMTMAVMEDAVRASPRWCFSPACVRAGLP